MAVALITGGSRGLGRALAGALVERSWEVIIDARDGAALRTAAGGLVTDGPGRVLAVPGDVADPGHRRELARLVERAGRLDLLVNNASILGPSPQPPLADYPLELLEEVYRVNVLGPLGLIQQLLPALLRSRGRIVTISSDAAVEAYAGWGGYGSAKAALDQVSAVLAAEQPTLRVYAVDPGDMRTALHQAAFPGEDISDRPEPQTVVPALLRLIDGELPSGRYRAGELAPEAAR